MFLIVLSTRRLNGMMNLQKNKGVPNLLLSLLMISVHKILKGKRIMWQLVQKKMNGIDFYV